MAVVDKSLRALADRDPMLVLALPESLFRFRMNAPTWVPLFELPPTLATRQPENGVKPVSSILTFSFHRYQLMAKADRDPMTEEARPEARNRFRMNAPTWAPAGEPPPTLATRQPVLAQNASPR